MARLHPGFRTIYYLILSPNRYFSITNTPNTIEIRPPLKVLRGGRIGLLYCHAFCQITRLIHIQSAQGGDVISQQLERKYRDDW